jgi:DUF1009 family protein
METINNFFLLVAYYGLKGTNSTIQRVADISNSSRFQIRTYDTLT